MPRFYIDQTISGTTICIDDGAQLHHLRDVLRLKKGESLEVFDAEGRETECSVISVEKNRILLEVRNRTQSRPDRVKICIACAIPRNSKMDEIIDKLTQLDVDTIIPMNTERVVVRLEEPNTARSRLQRWEKIAKNAAEQSQRNTLPRISPVSEITQVLAQSENFDLKLIASLVDPGERLQKVLGSIHPARVLALIGPEGDFTPLEVESASKSGFVPISLGKTVLRVDTAAIAVASYLKFSLMG